MATSSNRRRAPRARASAGPGPRCTAAGERPALARLAQVRLEPAEDPRVEVFAMLGRPAPQEQVRPAGIADELDLAPGLLQRDEHLLPLADRAAMVRLTVDDEG